MKSIIQSEKRCYICGTEYGTIDDHHLLGGPNRDLSEKFGLKIWLCRRCHSEIHNHNKVVIGNQVVTMLDLKQLGQRTFEEHYGNREEYIRLFGKNWL